MKTALILNMLLGIHITTRMLTSSARLSSSAAKAAQSTKLVVVIGGGAAGYFSAIECAKLLSESQRKSDGSPSVRYEVIVLEAGQKPLTKVLISGGGRCNVMHNPMKGPVEISKGYPRGSKELLGPLSAKFGPWETYDWFSSRGVDLKTEKDGRVFPTTDRSSSITEILEKAAKQYSVDVKCGARVTGIQSVPLIASLESSVQDPMIPLSIPLETTTTVTNSPILAGKSKNKIKEINVIPSQFVVSYVTSTSAVFDTMKNSKIDSKNSKTNSGEDEDDEGGGRVKEEKSLVCDKVIFATGGSRIGYEMLRGLGHTLVSPLPSLFSFKIPEKPLHELAGVSVQHSTVKLMISKEFMKGPDKHLARPHSLPLLTQKGALLISHQGFSGPAALRLSAFGAKVMAAMGYKFEVEVCWIPDVTPEDLFQHLWREKDRHPTRMMAKGFPPVPESLMLEPDDVITYTEEDPLTYVHDYSTGEGDGEEEGEGGREGGQEGVGQNARGVLTKRLWNYILGRCEIATDIKWEKVTKVEMNKVVAQLLTGRYSVTGRGMYRDEFVTCGGVPLKEVSFDTMESKVVQGLYLAGEVLDIDGVTGGYNFQSAWTAGWLAGHSAASSLLTPVK